MVVREVHPIVNTLDFGVRILISFQVSAHPVTGRVVHRRHHFCPPEDKWFMEYTACLVLGLVCSLTHHSTHYTYSMVQDKRTRRRMPQNEWHDGEWRALEEDIVGKCEQEQSHYHFHWWCMRVDLGVQAWNLPWGQASGNDGKSTLSFSLMPSDPPGCQIAVV